jgi:rhamnose transport system ATP-binding protein
MEAAKDAGPPLGADGRAGGSDVGSPDADGLTTAASGDVSSAAETPPPADALQAADGPVPADTPAPADAPPPADVPPVADAPIPADASSAGALSGGDGASAGARQVVLELRNAAKAFGAVQALADATIELRAGEAHALLGENGAGKSTLVKILAGVHPFDSGALLIDGRAVSLNSPAAARDAGIAVIYQEPTLFPDLTVAENIFMGRQPLRAGRRIDGKAMRAEAAALFGGLGVTLDPARICRGLSIADQQIVEIAKALSLDARVIVMDEPTAALSAAEVSRLFEVVATLRARGAAVLFISHRLEEVFAICQRVTVMRDGRHVMTELLDGLTGDDLVRAMVGRDMPVRTDAQRTAPGEQVLTVEHLTREGVFTDISFDVRAGEIVALAGLVGSGRSEVARAIFGIDKYDAGTVTVGGRKLRRASPTEAMAAGIGFVPEDRRQQGLVMDMSVQQNMALASLSRLRRGGLISSGAERTFATDWSARLRIKYGRLTDPVARLSGGNQQKVVLGKWLGRRPSLLIVDEPTRGIDIGTKAEVHRLLGQLAGEGVAVLMISSELPEVLQVGDRVLVMREGRLTTELGHAEATEERIIAAATGQQAAPAAVPSTVTTQQEGQPR